MVYIAELVLAANICKNIWERKITVKENSVFCKL